MSRTVCKKVRLKSGSWWDTALTLHATRPNTSRRFALGASNVCLVGKSPTCSVPALWGCMGIRSCHCGHARLGVPPPPSPPGSKGMCGHWPNDSRQARNECAPPHAPTLHYSPCPSNALDGVCVWGEDERHFAVSDQYYTQGGPKRRVSEQPHHLFRRPRR